MKKKCRLLFYLERNIPSEWWYCPVINIKISKHHCQYHCRHCPKNLQKEKTNDNITDSEILCNINLCKNCEYNEICPKMIMEINNNKN